MNFLCDDEGDRVVVEMPPPSTSSAPDAIALPLASQPPSLCGGHVAIGHGSRPLPPTLNEETPTPTIHIPWKNKLEVSHCKRKF